MPQRFARVTATVQLIAGIGLAMLLQGVSVRGLGAQKLPAGCGKNPTTSALLKERSPTAHFPIRPSIAGISGIDAART